MSNRKLTTDAELEKLQHESFNYFLHETNPDNGLVIDKTATDWPASIAATGFALAAYPVAVERGFMSHSAAVERTLTTLRFFWNSPQSPEPNATGYQGFYYHFLDMQTGRRAWQCELSTVDSTILLAGALAAGAYFDAGAADEKEIRALADALYRRADWPWAQDGGATVTHGWKPESGFLEWRWQGYDEALVLYLLGLGSPTHPLPAESYAAWASTYKWTSSYGYDYLYAGPLFTHQISHVWIDFRGIQDAFMRPRQRLLREHSPSNLCPATLRDRQPPQVRRVWQGLLGDHRERRPRPRPHHGERKGAAVLRLPGARGAGRTGRRHDRAVGRRCVAAVRAGDRPAGDRLPGARGRPQAGQPVRLQGVVQSDLSGHVRQSLRLGITVAFRDQPGADHPDDRELPDGLGVAPDAGLSVRRLRVAASGIHRRLAISRRGAALKRRTSRRLTVSAGPTLLHDRPVGARAQRCASRT